MEKSVQVNTPLNHQPAGTTNITWRVDDVGLESVRQRLHEVLESSTDDDWHMEPSLELNAAFCKFLGSEGDTNVKLDLVEIPSLSSLDPQIPLREKIKSYLEELDGAFFLIDETKLRTEAEGEILGELKEAFPTYSPQSHRLYICVSKSNIPTDSEVIDHTETQNYVAALLQDAGFYTHPSQVHIT